MKTHTSASLAKTIDHSLLNLGSLAVAAAPGLVTYVAGLAVIGLANTTFAITDNKWLLDAAPDDAGAVLSFFSLATAPAAIGASLVMGGLAQSMGSPLVFVVSAFGWLAGAVLLARLGKGGPANQTPAKQ